MESIIFQISKQTLIKEKQVRNTVSLLEEGATIPFISRYRKEMTDGLDEVQVELIQIELIRLKELEKRKGTILKSINEQGKLTDELEKRILETFDTSVLEDIYLPFKQKRKTKASVARENGLEPLAKMIMVQNEDDVERLSNRFVKGDVNTIEEAIEGARYIIAEWINEREKARNKIRYLFRRKAIITTKLVKSKEKEENVEKYKDYFDFSEASFKIKSHRALAIFRGEKEGILKVKLEPPKEEAIDILKEIFIKSKNKSGEEVLLAINDSYKRLLKPSVENELRSEIKEKADEQAIKVFGENLRQLLLTAPLGEKRVLGIDPGFRTGCKIVCVNEQGDLLHNETIFPHPPKKDISMSSKKIKSLVESYKIQAISIGNGTASRETERFIKNIKFPHQVEVFMVSEDGASIYSASKIGREEFPSYDVTVRGAVSIARRLMDPLSELVKIEPKSLGVGQYQHDVDQAKLRQRLDTIVSSAVNQVGVNVNTASKYLLTYVSGLGDQLAKNIVDYRTENGEFKSRKEIQSVPRMGNKSFEQCAGFLRIPSSSNPLDNSAVHPENYDLIKKMAKDISLNVNDLISDIEKIDSITIDKYIDEKKGIGQYTMQDIVEELKKPGRDPRKKAKVLEFSKDIRTIDDLKTGMQLPGIITNLTNFGAFVDIGLKQNGLLHISNITDEFISDPSEVLKLHQHVLVKVIDVEADRNRIGLSMKEMS